MNLFTKWLLGFLLLTIDTVYCFPQIVSINNPDLKFKEITLGYHYSDGIYSLKSTHLNEKGFGLFHNTDLESGIYYIFYGDSLLTELLFDADCSEKISIHYDNERYLFTFKGPPPSLQYNDYLNDLLDLNPLKGGISSDTTYKSTNESLAPVLIKEEFGTNKQYDSLLQAYINRSTSNFLTAFLTAKKQVLVPEYTPPTEVQNPDSAIWSYQISYYKKHFLDNINLSDRQLIHTPVYTKKINLFLDQITSQKPKNLCSAVDYVIDKASGDSVTHKFSIGYVLNKYGKQKKDPVSEYVYLYIIEKYYLQSGYYWITNNDKTLLRKEFDRLKPASIGQKAPQINLTDITGDIVNIYDLTNDLIVLYFMDYNCPLCENITKQITKTSQKFDYLNFNLVSICIGKNEEAWKAYIEKQGIGSWTNLMGKDQMASVALDYNLRFTPTIYLLNSDKVIIDKNMTASQLNQTFLNYALESNK